MACKGVLLTLKAEDSSKPKRIMQIDLSVHGIKGVGVSYLSDLHTRTHP